MSIEEGQKFCFLDSVMSTSGWASTSKLNLEENYGGRIQFSKVVWAKTGNNESSRMEKAYRVIMLPKEV